MQDTSKALLILVLCLSWTTSAASAPSAPSITSLTRSQTSPTSALDLVWTDDPSNPENVTYQVRLEAGTAANNVPDEPATPGTHQFTGLVPGESYTAVLYAQAADDNTTSDEVSSTPTFTVPNAPSDVAAVRGSPDTTTLDVAWTPAVDNAASVTYRVITFVTADTTIRQFENATSSSSHTVTGLVPGTRYTVRVRAQAADYGTRSKIADSTPVYTKPSPPSDVTAMRGSPGNTTLDVSWTAGVGNDPSVTYIVQVTTGNNITEEAATSNSSHTVTGLVPGTEYTVHVLAQTADDSVQSDEVSSSPVYTKPDAPSAVRALRGSPDTTTLVVTWTPGTDNAAGVTYSVRVTTGGNDVKTEAATSTFSHTVTGLVPGTQYTVHVLAQTTNGSVQSDEVSSNSVYTKPNAPSAVTAVRGSPETTTLVVTWTAGTRNADSVEYRVRVTTGGSDVKTDPATGTSPHTVTDLVPGTEYTVHVLAQTADGSVQSGEVSSSSVYTKPNAPSTVTAVRGSTDTTTLDVSWTPGANNAVSVTYRVRVVTEGSPDKVTTAGGTSPHTVTGLVPGTQYTVHVMAQAEDGNVQSGEISSSPVYTKPNAPSAVTAVRGSPDTTTLDVTWTPAADNDPSVTYRVRVTTGLNNITESAATNSSHTMTGLVPGAQYTVHVLAQTADGSVQSDEVSSSPVYTKPNVPTAVMATRGSAETTTLDVSWTPGTDNDPNVTYRVRVTTGGNNINTETATSSYSYTVTGLVPGAKYTVHVLAQTADRSVQSDEVSSRPVYTKPNSPSAVTAVRGSADTTTLDVTWTPGANNAVSVTYRVRVVTGGSPDKITAGSTSPHTVTGLVPGTQYTVHVLAQAEDSSVLSDEVASDSVYTNPRAPENVVLTLPATGSNTTSLTVTWTTPTTPANAAGVVYLARLGATGPGSVETSPKMYGSLNPATEYTVYVWAQVAGQPTVRSGNVTDSAYTAPSKPDAPTATATDTSSLRVTWTPVTVSGVTYTVYIHKSSTSAVKSVCTRVTSSCDVTVTTVYPGDTPGQLYTVYLVAVAGDGTTTSARSDGTNIRTKPPSVGRPTANVVTRTSVRIKWSAPTGYFTMYEVKLSENGTGDNPQTGAVTRTGTLEHSFNGLTPGQQYTVTIATNFMDGSSRIESVDSPSLKFYTKPDAPRNLRLTSAGRMTNSLTVTWNASANGLVDSYSLRRASQAAVSPSNPASRTHVFRSLTPGTSYTLYVWSVRGVQQSSETSITEFTVPRAPTSFIEITSDRTTSSVQVRWVAPGSGSGYQQFRLSISPADTTSPVTLERSVRRHTFSGLIAGKVYTLALSALVDSGRVQSGTVTTTAITKPNIPEAFMPPDTPQKTELTVSWSPPANSHQVDGYDWVVRGNMNFSKTGSTTTQTSFTESGLAPGTTYTVSITAKTTSGDKTATSQPLTGTATLKPEVVTGLMRSSVTTTSLGIQWTAPTGVADQYLVEWRVSGSSSLKGSTTVTTTSHTIPDLTPGQTYTVTVYARSNSVQGDGTSEDFTLLPSDTVAVALSAHMETTLTVMWDEPVATFDTYRLSIQEIGGSSPTTVTKAKSASQHQFTGLSPGRQYTVTIALVSGNSVGAGASNNFYTMPRMVENLTSQTLSTSSIRLTWTVNSDSTQDSFKITYGTKPKNTPSGQSSSIDITNLTPGESYRFSVQASVNSGNVLSTSVTATGRTNPAPVIDLAASASDPHTVELTWSAGANSVQDGYLVRYQGMFVATSWVDLPLVTGEGHTVSGLHPGEKYTFEVRAKSGTKMSEVQRAPAVTHPYNPQNLTVSEDGIQTQSIAIEWDYDSDLSYNTNWKVTYKPEGGTMEDSSVEVNTTSLILSALIPGQHYTITVHGVTVDNVTNTTGTTITATTKPSFVSVVTVSSVTTDTITLSYTEDRTNGVFDKYEFSINPPGSGVNTVTRQRSDVPREAQFTQLTSGTLYTIIAFIQSGDQRSQTKTIMDFTVPSTPRFTCEPAEAGTSITLVISRGAGLADSHVITCDGCDATTRTVELPELRSVFGGLVPSETYTFTLRAVKGYTGMADKESEVYQEMCTTKQSPPGPVDDFQHDPATLKPYEVNLSWNPPTKPNGEIVGYTLRGHGTKTDRPDHSIPAMDLSRDARDKTVTGLRAGYSYIFTIYARNIFNGTELAINVLTPILPPTLELPEPEARPRLPQNTEDPVKHDSITLEFVNPFSDQNSEITEYSVVVWSDDYTYGDTDRNTPLTDKDTWYERQRTKTRPIAPYQTIRCATLFGDQNSCFIEPVEGARRRRADTEMQGADPGDTTVLTVGADHTCNSQSHTYCNGPLEPETTYRLMLRAHNERGEVTDGYTSEPILTGKKPIPLVVYIVPPVVVILAVVVVVLVVLHRKGKLKRSKADETVADTEKPEIAPKPEKARVKTKVSRVVKKDDFIAYVDDMSKDSDFKFAAEYENLKPVGRDLPYSVSELPANRTKNRFTNILPYDHSRVKLLPTDDEEMGTSDYINANWMPGYNSKREFIVTQGPLPGTRDDFWRMVWEYNVHAIVMLTRCTEKGREKCDHYWPHDSEPMFYGDLQVSITAEEKTPNYVFTTLQIAQGEQTRTLTHYHYLIWPDFGVPDTPDSLNTFVTEVRKQLSYDAGPVIVHCSAGVGRSGTYIVVDRILQTIEEHEEIDIYGIVHEMRMHRPLMVQTEKQYVFIHKCLRAVLEQTQGQVNSGFDEEDAEQIYVNAGVQQ